MRAEADKAKLEAFMAALGARVRSAGRIYLTGGATALLHNWRASTIGHARDLTDVQAMHRDRLIRSDRLLESFSAIEPKLIRYPAIDPPRFREAVAVFVRQHPDSHGTA